MTPQQREAALRLADDMNTPISVWADHVAHLLRELASEPVQEPVAWLYESASGSSFLHRGFTNVRFEADMRASKEYPDGHKMTPLYIHPPQQRQPLTDYEIDRFWMNRPNLHDGELLPQLRDFARAIERAHGIGEAP